MPLPLEEALIVTCVRCGVAAAVVGTTRRPETLVMTAVVRCHGAYEELDIDENKLARTRDGKVRLKAFAARPTEPLRVIRKIDLE